MTTPVFIDTSALYAALDASDGHHARAAAGWNLLLDALADGSAVAVTHGSVLVEATALVQHRLGMGAVRDLQDRLVSLIDVEWVDRNRHDRALTALLAAGRRTVSLVDWTSFELMRELAIDVAFSFDENFEQQGFRAWH